MAQPQPKPDPKPRSVPDVPTGGGGGSKGRPPKVLTPDEALALIRACQGRKYELRDQAILATLWDTACRASELVAMQLADVDYVTDRVVFWRRKVKDHKSLKLWPATIHRIQTYLQWRRGYEKVMFPTGPLFASTRRPFGTLDRRQIHKLIRTIGREARVDPAKCHPHAFRHGRAVAMISDGAPLLAVQRRLGHSSVTTTEKYLDLADNWIDDYANSTGRLD